MSPSPGASCAGCWPSFRGSRSSAKRATSPEAAKAIEANAPELLFLDIKMPGGSGFDLLAKLEHVPRVIFTTAYDDHAVQAFEVNALDYLLKPIEPERLAGALARARGPFRRRRSHGRRRSSSDCSFATAHAAGSCRSTKCP